MLLVFAGRVILPFLLAPRCVKKLCDKLIDLYLLLGNSKDLSNLVMSLVMYYLGAGREHHTALEDKVHDIV